MSTLAVNAISPASGGTVTITGAALTTPALGTPASGNLANCTGLPASAVVNTPAGGISATTVQAALNELDTEKFDKAGGTVSGAVTFNGFCQSDDNHAVNNGKRHYFYEPGTTTWMSLYSPSAGVLRVANGSTNLVDFHANGLKAGPDAAGYSTSEPLAAVKDAAAGVNLVVRNGSSSASAYAGVIADGFGNSWGWRVGSSAANSNAWEMVVDALGSPVVRLKQDTSGNLLPGSDNAQAFGSGSVRWSTIYAGTGTINTSDAREKTEVQRLTSAEISAARAMAREIGTFRFLNGRRTHVGMTVQRAIEIMQACGLDPFKYGMICHDEWQREVVEHPAIEAQPATPAAPAVYETRESRETVILDGQETELVRTYLHEVSPAVAAKDAVQAQRARTEVIREAGDRYGFRYDQLMMFIAAGVLSQ